MSHWTSKDIAEMIGIAAIVLSLIFVGLQMKQSQEIAIAAQYQERANTANDVLLSFMENAKGEIVGDPPEFASRMDFPNEFAHFVGTMDPSELERTVFRFQALMTLYDNNLFQYEAGFLDEGSWLAFRNRMRVVLSSPFNRAYYRSTSLQYRPEFREVADQVIAEIDE